jgi:acyl carrier protein
LELVAENENIENVENVENIEEKVYAIVADQLDVEKEKIKPETSFINDLGADSLDIVELVMEFEEAFDMSIPDEDAEKIRTVGDAIAYIKEHRG